MRKVLLVFLVLGLVVAVGLQIAGGGMLSDTPAPIIEETPEPEVIWPSPEPSLSPLPTNIPEDIGATVQAGKLLEIGLTATAHADETQAVKQETAQAWQVVVWTAEAGDINRTATAAANATAYVPTATQLARIQAQESNQAAIRPFWDWLLPIVVIIVIWQLVKGFNFLLPFLAHRVMPHPDFITVPVEADPDDADEDPAPVEPPEFKVTLTNQTPGGYSQRTFVLPCSPKTFLEFCQGLAESNYKDFTEGTWVGKASDGKLFTRRKYVHLRDRLYKEKLITTIDPRTADQGFTSTAEGKRVFEWGAQARFDGIKFDTTPPP